MTGRSRPGGGPPVVASVTWAPEDLPITADTDPSDWWYVVLEELIDGVALLRRWPWPLVDPLGRLVWSERDAQQTTAATTHTALLRVQLYAVNGIQREPRIADTFALHGALGAGWRSRRVSDLRQLFADAAVYDITADAREAAKIAYHGSLGAVEPVAATPQPAREAVAATLRARTERHLPRLRVLPPPTSSPPVDRRRSGGSEPL